jgi:imidazolonepropionase-like amidohydrolase
MRSALGAAVGLLLLGAIFVAALVASVPASPVPPQTELRLAHVTVIEPGLGRRSDQTLVIREGRVASVEPSAEEEHAGPWDGLFVLPGLVDLHVHLPPPVLPAELRATLLLFLAHGVTTVRDAGSPWAWSLRTRDEVASGRLPGPRVLSCGPFVVGRESWPGALVVDEPTKVVPAIEELRRKGVDCVKLLDTLSPPIAAAIREEAHRVGLRVIGHVPSASASPPVDEVQHLTGLEGAMRTRHPADWEEAAAAARAGHVAHTPTLVVLERFAAASEGRVRCDPMCRFLPRYFETVLWDPAQISALQTMVTDLGFAPRDRFEGAKAVVGGLARVGVPILAGTDSPAFYNVPGASLHEEIRLLHEAGLSPGDALAAATARAAEAVGESRPGRIEPGARADLVLLRSDPEDAVALGAPLDVVAVIAGGRPYSHAKLEEGLEELQRLFSGAAYKWASETIARGAVAAWN